MTMTRVWELGCCGSDGFWGVVVGRFFGPGAGRECVFVDKVGAHLCGSLPWVFGLGGLGVFGSGDFVHLFSFMTIVVGPLLDLGTQFSNMVRRWRYIAYSR